jgi:hypothetical protein
MRSNSELNFFTNAVTNSLDSTAVSQCLETMTSCYERVDHCDLSGIRSICACVAEIISMYDLVGLHVARHFCGVLSGDVHSDRKNTLYSVWFTIAQDNDRYSGLEYRLANCSVPSSEY